MSYPDRLIDKRVVQRYIRKGMVDQTQYNALLEGLPDVEHNATIALDGDPAEAETGEEAEGAQSDEAPYRAE